jgi:hypothetical protein
MRLRFGATDNLQIIMKPKLKLFRMRIFIPTENLMVRDVNKDYGLIILADDTAYQTKLEAY